MSRQRENGRRWPAMSAKRPPDPPGVVALLESISLTALATDQTPRIESGAAGRAGDMLAALSMRPPSDEATVGAPTGEASAPRRRSWGRMPVRYVAAIVAVCLVASGSVGGALAATSASPPSAAVSSVEPNTSSKLVLHSTHLNLPAATSAPAPSPPSVALSSTAPHEVFAYAPYWSLPQASSFPVQDFSTIAYFSVDVNPNGSIDESGPGWQGYESQSFVDLVNRAHQAGDRVVLTASDFSEQSLFTLTHDPGAAVILGENLLELVETKNLDGINLDLEGTGSADQAGLDRLVSRVGFILRLADPDYQFTMATYASSASDPNGFYDIPGLAPSVDAFFVMAYDVSQGSVGQPGQDGGAADGAYVAQYLQVVPASKVILGVPLFGYDEPTSAAGLGASATGVSQAVTYAQAKASGPTYWNPSTDTAWTAYQSNGQWHQVFFDNANTLALKEQLASSSNLRGIGVWALGMEGSDDSVLAVLDGGSPPSRLPPVGPVASASAQVVGSTVGTTQAAVTTTTTTTTAARTHKIPKATTTTTTSFPKLSKATTTSTAGPTVTPTSGPKEAPTTTSTLTEGTTTTSASTTTSTGSTP